MVQAFLTQRGTPAWDGVIRLSGAVGLVGIPLALLIPEAGALVAFALITIWVHSPVSAFLPPIFEPLLILLGRLYSPVLLALIGTAANLLGEYLNYQIFKYLLTRRGVTRMTSDPWLLRLVDLFNRRPFLTTWFVGWSPVPDWTIRILGPLSKYPVRRYLTALALGRFPRFWLLASLGLWIHFDMRQLGWLVLIPLGCLGFVLARAAYRRRRSMGLTLPIPEPIHLAH